MHHHGRSVTAPFPPVLHTLSYSLMPGSDPGVPSLPLSAWREECMRVTRSCGKVFRSSSSVTLNAVLQREIKRLRAHILLQSSTSRPCSQAACREIDLQYKEKRKCLNRAQANTFPWKLTPKQNKTHTELKRKKKH